MEKSNKLVFQSSNQRKIDFGDGPFIPCEVINLPEPIVTVPKDDSSFKEQKSEEKIQSDKFEGVSNKNKEVDKITNKKQNTVAPSKIQTPKKNNMFVRGLNSVGRFIVEHPVESLEIVGVVIGSAQKQYPLLEEVTLAVVFTAQCLKMIQIQQVLALLKKLWI